MASARCVDGVMKENKSLFRPGLRVKGRYANCFRVGYNVCEFVIDFGQVYHDEGDSAEFYTRIITNPQDARDLLETMRKSIEEYENTFGTIRLV
jgi:hypothetical protein